MKHMNIDDLQRCSSKSSCGERLFEFSGCCRVQEPPGQGKEREQGDFVEENRSSCSVVLRRPGSYTEPGKGNPIP